MPRQSETIEKTFIAENSAATNKLISTILLLKSVMLIPVIIWIKINNIVVLRFIIDSLLIQNFIIVPITVFFVHFTSFKGKFVSVLLMLELIVNVTLSYFAFSSYATIQLVIPVIISTRALNKKKTSTVAAISWILFMLIASFQMIADKVSPTIHQIHIDADAAQWAYPIYTTMYELLPNSILFFAVYIICLSIINNGKNMIQTESQNAAKIMQVKSDLEMASKIQNDSLPPSYFLSPDKKVEINASEITSKEVGGDFYDYFMIDDTHIAFLVADVSDKGVPAALFMMSSKQAIKAAILANNNIDKALDSANRIILENNNSFMFLTIWIGVFDTETGNIKYVNAGHPFPILRKKQGQVSFVENQPEQILGVFESNYTVKEFNLEKGQSIILYSDGLTDALDVNEKPFGNDGLLKLIKKTGPNTSEIIKGISEYSKGTGLFDDSTVLSLTYLS